MAETPPFPEFGELPRKPGDRRDPRPASVVERGESGVGGAGERAGGPMRFASLGIELVAYVVVAGGIGFAIDKWRGGGAAWTVGGLLFGLVGGSVRFVRAALKAIREE